MNATITAPHAPKNHEDTTSEVGVVNALLTASYTPNSLPEASTYAVHSDTGSPVGTSVPSACNCTQMATGKTYAARRADTETSRIERDTANRPKSPT